MSIQSIRKTEPQLFPLHLQIAVVQHQAALNLDKAFFVDTQSVHIQLSACLNLHRFRQGEKTAIRQIRDLTGYTRRKDQRCHRRIVHQLLQAFHRHLLCRQQMCLLPVDAGLFLHLISGCLIGLHNGIFLLFLLNRSVPRNQLYRQNQQQQYGCSGADGQDMAMSKSKASPPKILLGIRQRHRCWSIQCLFLRDILC